jgi:c-di-AMP phosphodiesterase-like protein
MSKKRKKRNLRIGLIIFIVLNVVVIVVCRCLGIDIVSKIFSTQMLMYLLVAIWIIGKLGLEVWKNKER